MEVRKILQHEIQQSLNEQKEFLQQQLEILCHIPSCIWMECFGEGGHGGNISCTSIGSDFVLVASLCWFLYNRWIQLCCIWIYVVYIAYYNMETFCPERVRKKGCNMLGQKDEKGSMEAWAGISLHHQGKVCRSLGYVIDIVMNMMQLTISESEIAEVI